MQFKYWHQIFFYFHFWGGIVYLTFGLCFQMKAVVLKVFVFPLYPFIFVFS
jgi:hypothetical protein